MHGPLNEIGLIEVLQLLERGRRSGVLRVVGADPARPRMLWIAKGRVVALEPDAGDAAVATALVARHLVAAGDASHDAVPLAVREQVRGTLAKTGLIAMLHWTHGRFDFESGEPQQGPLSISPERAVLDLVDAESRRVELAERLDNFAIVPAFLPARELAAGATLHLSLLDWRILDAIDGVRSIAAVADVVREPVEDVAERILALEGLILVLAPARVDAVQRFERALAAWESWRHVDPEQAPEAASLIEAARTMLEALHDSRE